MTMTGLHLRQCAQYAGVRLLSEKLLLVWNERLAPVVWVGRAWAPVWLSLVRAPLSNFPICLQTMTLEVLLIIAVQSGSEHQESFTHISSCNSSDESIR